jgi:hypothetical protein
VTKSDLQRAAETLIKSFNANDFDQIGKLLTEEVRYDEHDTPFHADSRTAVIRRFHQLKSLIPRQLLARVDKWTVEADRGVAGGRIKWIVEDRQAAFGFLLLAFNEASLISHIHEYRADCSLVVIPTTG